MLSTDKAITSEDNNEAKLHLFIALDEMRTDLPKTHEDLIERMRDYFSDQKVEVFSRIVTAVGEEGFKDYIADAVVESGLYARDEQGQIKRVMLPVHSQA